MSKQHRIHGYVLPSPLGDTPVFARSKEVDDAVLARCARLEAEGHPERAEKVLELYCSRLRQ